MNSVGAEVVILLRGNMTRKQKQQAKENSKLRIDALVSALRWLKENNKNWKNADVDAWTRHYQQEENQPYLIDESYEEDDSDDVENLNIERTEKVHFYFPDGEVHELTGGHKKRTDFLELVQRSKESGFDLELQCDFERETVMNHCHDDIFVHSNLLQFPYGVGGLYEERFNKEGNLIHNANVQAFTAHMMRLSLSQFHRPLYVLIIYNIYLRLVMMKRTWQMATFLVI